MENLTAIKSKEHAEAALEKQFSRVARERSACETAVLVEAQRKSYYRFLMEYGNCLGQVLAYFRCGLIDAVGYNVFRDKLQALATPTIRRYS